MIAGWPSSRGGRELAGRGEGEGNEREMCGLLKARRVSGITHGGGVRCGMGRCGVDVRAPLARDIGDVAGCAGPAR